MTTEQFYLVAAIGIGILVLAFLVQTGLLIVMARAARAIKGQLEHLSPRAESLMDSAEKTLADSRKQISEVTAKANAVLDTTKNQVEKTSGFLTEATDRARAQLDWVELVLDDTITRVHQTAVMLNDGVLRPLRELNGIVAGVRGAVAHLLRGGRPDVSQATTDEEMFI